VNLGPSRTGSTTRASRLILDVRFVDLGGQIPLVAIVPSEQLGDDDRIGEEVPFEFLLVDDLVEIIGIDPDAPSNARITLS
jgi:hypothetical protein